MSRRGVVIRISVKEVPKCLLRESPKIVLVEASNVVLANKKSSKRELCECGVKSVYRVNFQNRVLEGRIRKEVWNEEPYRIGVSKRVVKRGYWKKFQGTYRKK